MKHEEVMLKAVRTALEMSDQCIRLLKGKNYEKALSVLDHRGRVVSIILHLGEQITPAAQKESQDFENQLNRLILTLNSKDQEISELLIAEKLVTQNEIAKTRKNKDNFKGYNLNDLK